MISTPEALHGRSAAAPRSCAGRLVRAGGQARRGRSGHRLPGARHRGREVAVKLLHARLGDHPQARRRFVRELELAERIAGYCTARVLDADVRGDQPYIVSQFVRGPSLAEVVNDDGPLDTAGLMWLAIGTATALTAIHRAGIVHRDFKPANVLLGQSGPRVFDFGIARALDASHSVLTSQVVGTPTYMAPEQIAGDGVGFVTDVFAWGGTMVFAATGRPPFGNDSIPAVMHRVLSLEADLRGTPEPLAELVAACLAKDPARRPSSLELLSRLMGMVGAEVPLGTDVLERGATLVDVPVSRLTPTLPADSLMPTAPPAKVSRRWAPAAAALAVLLIAVPTAVVMLLPDDRGSGSDAAQGTVRIGVMASMTGEGNVYGKAAMAGTTLAVAEHNAQNPKLRAELVPMDTGGRAEEAVPQAQRAAGLGLAAVVGPMFSGESQAVMPLFERQGLPSVSPSASGPPLATNGWTYWHTMAPDVEETVGALVPLLRRHETGKLVVLDDGQAYPRAVADVFVRRAKAATRVTMRSDATDHGDVVWRLKDEKADSVFYSGYYTTAGPLIKQAREAGFKGRFYLTDAAFGPELLKLAGSAADGTTLTCPCLNVGKGIEGVPSSAFLTRYAKANGGQRPVNYTAESYDAMNTILAALKAGKRTPVELNEFLRGIDLPGVTQRIRFNQKGQLTNSISYAYQVRNGAFTFLGDSRTAALR
ncbi:bifunctional serine/threonine-protein kinase/ABC transporter substrate-binding protein [Actinomadura fulvescens]|uniref:bifunctional serine/threonine-protein kinase/ABC transporter substrate-binding protein n=1 Tax=Actinomadura fulvescens TaxID=46160 RepID=UPI0031D4076C